MSHYTIAVIGVTEDELDVLMQPYSEHLEVDPYVEMTFDEAVAQACEAINRNLANNLRKIDMLVSTDDFDARAALTGDISDEEDAIAIIDVIAGELGAVADGWKWLIIGDEYSLLMWYATDWCGFSDDMVDEDYNLLTTYNPDSKWDYYTPYDCMTMAEWRKSGELDADEADDAHDFWFGYVLGGDEAEKGGSIFTREYYLEKYGDYDTFLAIRQLPVGYAVLTPDGEWHAPGRVGWFAVDTSDAKSNREFVESFYERFCSYPDDTLVTFVDCHI